MKRLTIITIGIMIPTFVVSLFSMNVRIPFSEYNDAFFLILGFSVLSVGLLYSILKIKKW